MLLGGLVKIIVNNTIVKSVSFLQLIAQAHGRYFWPAICLQLMTCSVVFALFAEPFLWLVWREMRKEVLKGHFGSNKLSFSSHPIVCVFRMVSSTVVDDNISLINTLLQSKNIGEKGKSGCLSFR